MGYSVVLSQKAKKDLQDILDYYNPESTDIAKAFLKELISSIDSIGEYPKAGPVVFDRMRKRLVSRFPFLIFYTIRDSAQEVGIARIWHQKRDPQTFAHG